MAATIVVMGSDGPIEGARAYPTHAPVDTLEGRLVAREPVLTDAEGRVELPRWTEADERWARRMARFARRQRRQARSSFCGTWNILDPTVNAVTVSAAGMLPVQVDVSEGGTAVVELEPAEPWVVDLGTSLEGCTLEAQLGGRSKAAALPRFEPTVEGSSVVLPYRSEWARITGRCADGALVAGVVGDEVSLVRR